MPKPIKTMSIADIHLCGGIETDEAQALLKAADIAIAQDVDVVLVNGDVYHSKSTPAQRFVFFSFLRRLRYQGIQAVILRGNHDEKDDLSIFHDSERGIHVLEMPDSVTLHKDQALFENTDLITIHGIPHYNAAALAQAESSQDRIGETGTGLYDQLLHGIFQKVQTTNHASIVTFHGTVTDAHLDNGHIPKHDGIVLNGPLLASIGCPVRGGHYHAAQEPHPNVRYSGSIVLRNYGETGDKGVLIDTFEGGRWTGCEFVSLDPSPRVTVEAEWGMTMSQDPESPIYAMYAVNKENEWRTQAERFKGAKVRFRYIVKQSDAATVELEPIKRFFEQAGVRELKFERDLIIETAVRNESIHQANTVLDAHEAWLGMKNLEAHIPIQRELYNQIVLGVEPVQAPALTLIDGEKETNETAIA